MVGKSSKKLRIPWTNEEDDILKKYYPIEGIEVLKRLPNRSEQSCMDRARHIGIQRNKKWTKLEDDILKKYYPLEGGNIVFRLPNRSVNACGVRARSLGLRYNKK